MRGRALHQAVTAASWTGAVVAAAVLVVGVALAVPSRPLVAVAASLAVLGIGLTLAEPAVIPLLAIPAMVVVTRVSGGGVDLSLSDLAIAVAFWPAVFLGTRPYSREMRTLLWLSAVYQVALVFTLVANPYRANVVDWFHTWLLVSGSLVVGWVVGRRGYARLGINLLMLGILAIAALTIVQGLRQVTSGDFSPVYLHWPYHMHKNFIGALCGIGAAIAYARPPFAEWNRRRSLTMFWVLVAAILASQSRQALIALGVVLVVIVLRRDHERSRSKLIILAFAPALALVGLTVKEQVQSGNEFNSVFQRLTWYQDATQVWLHDPIFGVGLRWWYTDRFSVRFQPPNAEMEVLTTAGVVGLIGFLVLMVGALIVLWRLDPAFGTVAVATLVTRLVQGQFDLFWTAVQTSLPFLVAGVCVGALAHARASERVGPLPALHRAEAPA